MENLKCHDIPQNLMLFIAYKVGVFVYFRHVARVTCLARRGVFVMAENSLCEKVNTKCRVCRRKIKRSRCSEDNLCDNCDKTIELCDSKKDYKNVKKINILSGLLVNRKNNFLFVGEGNFSFTVAFNAYRQILWDKYDDSLLIGVFNQQHFRIHAYPPGYMVAMLIHLHECTITCEPMGELVQSNEYKSASKLTESVTKCLNVSCSKLQEALPGHQPPPQGKSCCLAEVPVLLKILKHLFKSIQELNSANKYLLELIFRSPLFTQSLRKSYIEVNKALQRLKSFLSSNFRLRIPDILTKHPMYLKHVISVIIVDDMAQDVAGCVTQPTMDVISSRYDNKPYKKTISEVKEAMLQNFDGYDRPPEEIAVDCTDIHQMGGIDARSIPPEIARWSNLIWFQCPWVAEYHEHAISDLILVFLGSAADNCAPGTYVCIGITTHEDYMHRYCLERILGANLDSCTLDQYEFLGVDDVLIKKLLSYGYKHESKSGVDIHNLIRSYHVTLVFRLKYLHNSYFSWCTKLRKEYEKEHDSKYSYSY